MFALIRPSGSPLLFTRSGIVGYGKRPVVCRNNKAVAPKSMLLLLLLVCLTGCAVQLATDTSGKPDIALQKRLAQVNQWQLSGKLAVRTPTQSESAQIQWQQEDEHFDIRLSGPAGLKATHIYGKPGDVNFEQGDRRENAASVEALSQRLIGWPLPAAELAWWLRGLPASSTQAQSEGYTPEGWLAYLVQDGWTIQFSQHKAVGNVTLPGRIEALRGDAKIILIIKDWQVR